MPMPEIALASGLQQLTRQIMRLAYRHSSRGIQSVARNEYASPSAWGVVKNQCGHAKARSEIKNIKTMNGEELQKIKHVASFLRLFS